MAAAPLIAMDPEKTEDQFYRYKMPAIITKVEGNGNGIKTVFPNIHEVCAAINRPESIMMKFFQFELGTQKTVSAKDDKFIVTGSRTQETMQGKVYDFIKRFVLCKHCRNPETTVLVDSKDNVTLRCGACGKTSMVSANERATSLLAQHYKGQKVPPKQTTEAPKQQTTADVVADHASPTRTSTAPAKPTEAAPTSGMVDDRGNPAVILAKALQSDPSNIEAHVRLVFELRSSFNMSDKSVVRLVLLSIIETDEERFLSGFQAHAKLLARFALVKELAGDQALDEASAAEARKREESLQAALISECERYVVSKGTLFKFPISLKVFFDTGVVKQQSIEAWKPSSKLQKEQQEELKTFVKPLLAWLATSD